MQFITVICAFLLLNTTGLIASKDSMLVVFNVKSGLNPLHGATVTVQHLRHHSTGTTDEGGTVAITLAKEDFHKQEITLMVD